LRYITINAPNTVMGQRDYFLFVLGFSTGLRLSEIQRLTLSNFYEDENEQWWIRVRGKRNNMTPIAIDSHIKFLADVYVDAYNKKSSTPITPTTPIMQPILKGDHIAPLRPKGMTQNSIADIIGKWSHKAIGIKLAPHDLRRSFATNALRDGWDIIDISIAMRHGSIKTTTGYLGKFRHDKPKTMRIA
jgi:integrase